MRERLRRVNGWMGKVVPQKEETIGKWNERIEE